MRSAMAATERVRLSMSLIQTRQWEQLAGDWSLVGYLPCHGHVYSELLMRLQTINDAVPPIGLVSPASIFSRVFSVVSIKVDATTEWSDSVYMESCPSKTPYVLVADREKDQIYVSPVVSQKQNWYDAQGTSP